MERPLPDPLIAAAVSLWEPLAAFAWGQFVSDGRGVVLLEQAALENAAAQVRRGGTVSISDIEPGYVCVRDVPPSDDFAPIIAEYDPQRQIVLLVRLKSGEERLFVLETSERQERATPRECFETMLKRNEIE